jgi:hypothetical protein
MMYIPGAFDGSDDRREKGGGGGAYCTFRSHSQSHKLTDLDDESSFEGTTTPRRGIFPCSDTNPRPLSG